MIRFALIVASTLGFVLTAALGNLFVPLSGALRPGRCERTNDTTDDTEKEPQNEPETPVVPEIGGVCIAVGVLAAVGVGWTAACVARPDILGSESQLTSRLLIALLGALAFGAVGLADDAVRLRRRSTLGLHAPVRLALELAAGAAVLGLLALRDCLADGFTLPGVGYIALGRAAPVVWELLLTALAECAHAANGADGTVCGAGFVAMLGLMGAMTLLGWFPLAVLPAAAAGSLMAFLLWNFPPARFRPGAAGCQLVAGLIGCVPLCIGWPGITVPLALPFWLEGGMLGLQVLAVRCTHGRRGLFSTAPLHRWLEARGHSAVTIFYVFCLLAVVGFALAVQAVKFS